MSSINHQPKPSYSIDHHHQRTLSSTSAVPSRSSSLVKVWTGDYFDADNCARENYEEDTSITPPPAAAPTARPSPGSIPLSASDESCPVRQTRTHQRSLTALLSFRAPSIQTNSTSPQHLPAKEKLEEEPGSMPTLTGDTIRGFDKSKAGLSSWFTGSSAPVSVGVLVAEQESSPSAMGPRDVSPERPATKLKKRPILPTLDSNSSPQSTPTKATASASITTTSRFNFFSSPRTPVPKAIQLPQTTLDNDEFLTLDIKSALFPSNPSAAQDPFSPSAFKNLLMNAEGLLLKLQTVYKLRTLSLHELSAEREAMRDELEEAETRAQSLRAQLEDMAQKVSEQDRAMEDLVRQLAVEKQARVQKKEATEKSIALVKTNRKNVMGKRESCCSSSTHEGLRISIRKEGRRWRHSRGSGSTDLSTAEGGESDNESGGGESIFSRSRSPTLTASSATSVMAAESPPELLHLHSHSHSHFPAFNHGPNQHANSSSNRKPKMVVERPSTFQKILKGISTSTTSGEPDRERDAAGELTGIGGMERNGCENCTGQDASVAWDAISLLRAENKDLKERVNSLEGAVEAALDLCSGLRL